MNGCSPCTEERLDSVEELGKRVAGCQSGLRSSASSDLALHRQAVLASLHVKNREQSKKGVRKRPTQRSTNTRTQPLLVLGAQAVRKPYCDCGIRQGIRGMCHRPRLSLCVGQRLVLMFVFVHENRCLVWGSNGCLPHHTPPECTTGQKPLGTTICCSTLSFTASLYGCITRDAECSWSRRLPRMCNGI
jgi:hypothetical protein